MKLFWRSLDGAWVKVANRGDDGQWEWCVLPAGAAAWWASAPWRLAGDEAVQAARALAATSAQWRNASNGVLDGRLFEEAIPGSFNVRSARASSPERAFSTASQGYPHATADVVTTSGLEAQLKRYNSAEATATALARPRYGRLAKIVPRDQLEAVTSYAAIRAQRLCTRNPERALAMRDTADRATDRLVGQTVASDSFSTGELRALAERPQAFATPTLRAELAHSAAHGLLIGAVVNAGASGVSHGIAVSRGEESLPHAARAVARDAAYGGAAGLAISGGATLLRRAMPALGRGAAPVAIAATALDLGAGAVDWRRGRITGSQFVERSAENLVLGAAAWGGAEAGAALGSLACPVLGTAAGALIGGLGSWLGARALLRFRR